MFMPSPLTFNCRRRSHSASSPSPSPSPAPASSWRPSHKRAHSSHRDTPTLPDPQRCHLDIWRTGKRARKDISPTQPTRSSTPASTDSTASSSSSTPHTPLFPASSTDFLFSSHCKGNQITRNPHNPSSAVSFLHDETYEPTHSELARLRSEAFSELRRSVQENGEGFVKRMREFEDSRSKSAQHSRPRGIDRRRRKRYSPSVPTTRFAGKVTVSDDDDDDVLIFLSTLDSGSSHSRQRRSSSLGAMDDCSFQFHCASNSSGRLSPISSIFRFFSFHPSTTSRSAELSTSFSTSFDFTNLRHANAFKPTSSHPSSDSLAPSGDVFLSSSHTKDADLPSSSLMVSPPQPPCQVSAGIPTSAGAEKVIAALTLAMASGAGSLGDYKAARALDISSANESQAGELWH